MFLPMYKEEKSWILYSMQDFFLDFSFCRMFIHYYLFFSLPSFSFFNFWKIMRVSIFPLQIEGIILGVLLEVVYSNRPIDFVIGTRSNINFYLKTHLPNLYSFVARSPFKNFLMGLLYSVITKKYSEVCFPKMILLYLDFFFCIICLLYTSPSPRDRTRSRMPSSA